ncbi:hypothetical protein FQR65_LT03505 [Abscondita terminalis]|nr:hypothetical protein FQR65_LT03505 [Abscondita terminalis]
MIENSTIKCRICLLEVVEDEKFYYLNDNNLMLKSKLLGFLPELDLTITQNPVACGECSIEIDKIHRFRHLCLQNEINLKNQTLLETSSNNILSLVEDECLLVNTDVPLWIEESTSKTIFYYCHHCHYATNDKRNLAEHIFTHRFKCSRCSYTTLDDVAFTSHKEIHSTEEELENVVRECRDSGYQANTESALNRRLLTHKSRRIVKSIVPYSSAAYNNKIKCPKCRYTTSNRKNLNVHLVRVHKETENVKPESEVIEKNPNSKEFKSNLNEHKLNKKQFRFKCTHCKYKTNTIGYFIRHNNTIHSKRLFYCDTCDYSNMHLFQIKNHMNKYSGQSPQKCEKCGYKNHVKIHFMMHLKKHDPKCTLKCQFCVYKTPLRARLNAHLMIHTGEKPYACKRCSYRSSRSSNLRTHEKRKHGGVCIRTAKKLFVCKICNYMTHYQNIFKAHEARHSEDQPIERTSIKLKTIQVKSKQQELPFRCDTCDYSSQHLYMMNRHIAKYSGESPLKCDKCDFKSHVKKQFIAHRTEHNVEKIFRCDHCDYKTSSSRYFNVHLCVHNEEKLFSCKFCNYKSPYKHNIRRHETHHSTKCPSMNGQPDKIFKCNDCNYWTYVKARFNEHLMVHTGEQRYACELCNFRSSYKANLKKHEKVHFSTTNELQRLLTTRLP